MKRPVGVILTAIFVLGGSLLFAGMAVFESILMLSPPKGVAMPEQAKLGLGMGVAIFGVLAVWGITTGVGLFRLKNWARISQIVFSVLLALVALVSAPVVLIIPLPPNVPPDFGVVMKAIAAVYAALGLLGLGWIFYFLRPNVKAVFAGSEIEPSRRPLSISIIGWWLLLTGVCTMPFAFLHYPIVLLGLVLRGWNATAFMIIFGLVYVVVGFELLKLNETARLAAIALQIFFAINGVLMALLPGTQQLILEQMRNSPFTSADLSRMPSFPPIIFLFSVPVLAVPLWFLVTRKRAFEHRPMQGGTLNPA